MKVYLGADHAGFELKRLLVDYVQQLGHEAIDCGNTAHEPSDNYPDFIFPVAESVARDDQALGIVIGGSGQGEAMAANKLAQVRAVVFYGSVLPKQAVDVTGRQSADPYEIIKLTREHNNSNVLSLGARFLTPDEAKGAVKIWLETPFSEAERHSKRIKQVESEALSRQVVPK